MAHVATHHILTSQRFRTQIASMINKIKVSMFMPCVMTPSHNEINASQRIANLEHLGTSNTITKLQTIKETLMQNETMHLQLWKTLATTRCHYTSWIKQRRA